MTTLTDNTITDIKIELIRRGMTQRELADAIHVSPQLVSGVLTGRIRSLPTELKIIKYLRDTPYLRDKPYLCP